MSVDYYTQKAADYFKVPVYKVTEEMRNAIREFILLERTEAEIQRELKKS